MCDAHMVGCRFSFHSIYSNFSTTLYFPVFLACMFVVAPVPMMNHHTMPKYGFGKTSAGSFYLPKICTKGGGIGGTGKCGSGTAAHNTVSLELSHGNNKQLITLPAEKLDNNKRYYVTFTLKDNERAAAAQKDAALIQSSVQPASDKKTVE